MSDFNVPAPKAKVVNFDQLTTFDQTVDYAAAGFHAADKASAADTPTGRLWKDAAAAYFTAYTAITALEIAPNADGLAKAKALLHDANRASDIAAASAKH